MSTPEETAAAPVSAGPSPEAGAGPAEEVVAPPRRNVKKAALWTLVGYGGGQLVRFASNIILTRLLLPDVFGLISLVYTFMTGLHMFTDVGINTSIIQSK